MSHTRNTHGSFAHTATRRVQLSTLFLTAGLALAITACGDATQPTGLSPASPRRTTSTALSVTQLSRSNYQVAYGALAAGAKIYVDRTYTFDAVAGIVANATYIRTANDDKDVQPGSTSFFSFTVNQPVTVYVAHDEATALPTWLKTSFKDAAARLTFTDPAGNKKLLHLYSRSYAAGTVTLGANGDQAVGGTMYEVVVVPSTTTTTSPDTSPPAVTITAPTAGATVSSITTVSATASGSAGVAGVTFKVDGTTIGAEDTASPYAVSWNTTTTTNGSHTITAVARDSAGRTATTSVAVTVQNSTTTVTHKGWYVSPSGTSAGDGSSARPWSIATAFAGPKAVAPGDTIWLRGGTYKGAFVSYLTGTASAPIIMRQYPGERATIDGTLLVNGAYTWYWGFEVISTVLNPQDQMAVDINGPGVKAINMVVHDAGGNGFGMYDLALDGEVYGNIIYNNGRQRLDGVYAHGIYAHSTPGHMARIVDNVVFNQFGYGLHMYTESGSLSGFLIEGNTVFESGRSSSTRGNPNVLVGGAQPAERITVQKNYTYQTSTAGTNVQLGYFTTKNKDIVVKDNYVMGGQPALRLLYWSTATVSGNTFYQFAPWEMIWTEGPTSTWSWTSNSYWHSATDGGAWYNAPNYYDLAGFKTLMRNTTDASLGTKPTASKVFVRPNQYEKGRANVTVFNWANLGSVSVDMTGILAVGDSYEVRNVRDFYGTPVAKGVYGGGSISIPITAVPNPVPLGGFVSTPPTSTTEFQTYVVKRVGT